jgi:hypothetical protein
MMKFKSLGILLIVLTFFSCSNTIEIEHLNGYWEIEKVKLANGETKEYTVNLTVDYFKVENNNSGYRKKVQPKFDGTYTTTNDAENFTINTDNKNTLLLYKNSLSEWQETITKLTTNKLVIVNTDNNTYFYKRYIPIDISN